LGVADVRSDLKIEVERTLRRTWRARILPGILVVAVALLVGAWFSAPLPSPAVHAEIARLPSAEVHAELARLRNANEVIGLVLMIVAFLSAYLILTPDLNEAYDSLSVRGGSRPLTFAAGRALVGVAGLIASAAVLGLTVEALDFRGRHELDELVDLAVKCANATAVFMLVTALVSVAGRIIGMITSFFLLNIGTDSAYHQGAVADGFIDPTSLVTAEKYLAFLAPPPLIDPLTGIAMIDQSIALQQFPVWEGNSIWGAELIQVSRPPDVIHYAVYLAAVSALFYLSCLRRARQARARLRPTTWIGVAGDPKPGTGA
jgi:hypothetical protein